MPSSPPQQGKPATAVDLHRQQLAQKYLAAHRSGTTAPPSPLGPPKRDNRFADRRCWLCRASPAVCQYDRCDLCLECAEDVLRHVLMPLLAPLLVDVDIKVEAAIADAESVLASSPISPLTSDIAPSRVDPTQWTCWKCKAIHSDTQTSCQCCKNVRPPDPTCCRCDENILSVKRCSSTGADHKSWQCNCSLDNTEEAVQCRGCRSSRKWYCASCSLENSWTRRTCDACGGDKRVDNVNSVVNREFLQQMGFSSDAQSLHREQQKQVESLKEHTRRLEQRVEKIGLFPIPIDDDGNCLFRALSYQLARTDAFHHVVRHLVVDYMERHQTEYALLIGGDDFESYVTGMRRNTIWGDELCVHAASHIFGAHIHVITSEENRWHLRYEHTTHNDHKKSEEERKQQAALARRLFLCYRSPDHYYCLVHPDLEPKIKTIDLEASLKIWGAQQAGLQHPEQPLLDRVLLQRRSSGGDLGASVNSSASSFGGKGGMMPPSPQRSPMAVASRTQLDVPVIPARLPPRSSPPTTQEVPKYTYPQQQQLPPPPANPPQAGRGSGSNVHVVLTPKVHSDSPPALRRQKGALPTTTSAAATFPADAPAPAIPSTRTGQASHTTAVPPLISNRDARDIAAAAAAANGARPVTRSTRMDALQYSHFMIRPHPIVVQVCVAQSDLNLFATQRETVRQDKESTPFYLYAIEPKVIIEGGPQRYPWESIYQQTVQYREEIVRVQKRQMPLFLLQHIETGGFVCPSDDLVLRKIFHEQDPLPCAPLVCKKTRDLASCLLTVCSTFTQSRTKLFLKFFKKEISCSYLSFVPGSADVFCSSAPIDGSLLVIHQMFNGAAERRCLRCKTWYVGGSRGVDPSTKGAGRSPGECDHFSHVDEMMEVISRY